MCWIDGSRVGKGGRRALPVPSLIGSGSRWGHSRGARVGLMRVKDLLACCGHPKLVISNKITAIVGAATALRRTHLLRFSFCVVLHDRRREVEQADLGVLRVLHLQLHLGMPPARLGELQLRLEPLHLRFVQSLELQIGWWPNGGKSADTKLGFVVQ